MIVNQKDNILEITSDQGFFALDDDVKEAVCIQIFQKELALIMHATYTTEELMKVLNNKKESYLLQSSIQTKQIGRKKVIETIFDYKNRTLIFLSEDTTYKYSLLMDEWKAMFELFQRIISQKSFQSDYMILG